MEVQNQKNNVSTAGKTVIIDGQVANVGQLDHLRENAPGKYKVDKVEESGDSVSYKTKKLLKG